MLYADDAGVVSQSPEQLGKMVGVIVVACAAVGRPVSEAKIKMMHLRKKGMPGSTTIFSVKAAEQVYNQTNEFLYLGGTSTRPVHRGQPVNTQCMVQLPEVHPRTIQPTERSPRAQNRDA